MSTPLERPLIDVEEAAGLTRTSVQFIRKIIAKQQLPVVRMGRLIRIRPADLEAYMARNTRGAR